MAARTGSEFDWLNDAACDEYVAVREIALDQVHYGWLCPGEDDLRLLAGLVARSRILDIGCGAAENLIALAQVGHECYGVDISPRMIWHARRKIQGAGLAKENRPAIERCDMRDLTVFPGLQFDAVISAYSFEFLDSLREFRNVLAAAYARTRPGGVLVCCFSHPLQHYAHTSLLNETGRIGVEQGAPLMFSFRDTVQCITQAGYVIDRIIEQSTRNPSSIAYEDSRRFPYHFAPGRNPCRPEYDSITNAAPHTVVYKLCKPESGGHQRADLGIPSLALDFGAIVLWGKERTIVARRDIGSIAVRCTVLELAPFDSLVAVCVVASFKAGDSFPGNEAYVRVQLDDGTYRKFRANSLAGLVHKQLKTIGVIPVYRADTMMLDDICEIRSDYYMHRIDPLSGELASIYHGRNLGVIFMVNGTEPGMGTVSASEFVPQVGDEIQVLYVVTGWGREWRDGGRRSPQLELF